MSYWCHLCCGLSCCRCLKGVILLVFYGCRLCCGVLWISSLWYLTDVIFVVDVLLVSWFWCLVCVIFVVVPCVCYSCYGILGMSSFSDGESLLFIMWWEFGMMHSKISADVVKRIWHCGREWRTKIIKNSVETWTWIHGSSRISLIVTQHFRLNGHDSYT